MRALWQAAMGAYGLAALVSSLLITLAFRPLAKNAILMGRSIRSASHAVVLLLARGNGGGGDDGGGCDDFDEDDDDDDEDNVFAAPAGRHCERCAARQLGAPLSGSDAAEVLASLGLLGGGGGGPRDQRDEVGEEADGMAPPSAWRPCGGCEAMGVVEELAESKAAGEGELREAFGVFDRDGDGFVCAGELWSVMLRLGMAEGARYEDCVRMVAARDGDGDGRVSFAEFRAMMENAV